MKALKSLADCGELALEHEGECESYNCEGFKIIALNRVFVPYEATISHGNITLSTDIGCLTYVVDNYGDDVPRLELFDWEIYITSEVKEKQGE